MKRRDFLAASGAAALAGVWHPAFAQAAAVRQGYQTNMWGMPTYYLLRSGALEKLEQVHRRPSCARREGSTRASCPKDESGRAPSGSFTSPRASRSFR